MAAGDDSSVALAAPTGNADVRMTANNDVRQVVVPGNAGDRTVGVMPYGALETFTGLATLFYDSWTGTVPDTIDKWQVTGTAPTLLGGTMTMPTAAGYHAVRTQDTVRPNAGFTLVRNGVRTEAATPGTGSSRFIGLGTTATTPSATVLAQDGVGFEWDAAGALFAVVYSGGAKTYTQALTRPTDGAIHAYEVQFRVTSVVWHIDNLQVPVASLTFPNIAVVELPALISRFNGTSAGVTFDNIAHLTGDTSRQAQNVADPVIGTRVARVTDPASSLANAMGSTAALSTAYDASTGAALNVNPNAVQKATYRVAMRRDTAAYTVGTIQWHLSLHHAASATRAVRIRRVEVAHTIGPTATTGSAVRFEMHRLTAAPTGTALAAGSSGATGAYLPVDGRLPAGEVTALTLPTATSAGLLASGVSGSAPPAAHGAVSGVLYDWQEGGEQPPIILRPGVLEGIAIGSHATIALAVAANVSVVTVEVSLTEE